MSHKLTDQKEFQQYPELTYLFNENNVWASALQPLYPPYINLTAIHFLVFLIFLISVTLISLVSEFFLQKYFLLGFHFYRIFYSNYFKRHSTYEWEDKAITPSILSDSLFAGLFFSQIYWFACIKSMLLHYILFILYDLIFFYKIS